MSAARASTKSLPKENLIVGVCFGSLQLQNQVCQSQKASGLGRGGREVACLLWENFEGCFGVGWLFVGRSGGGSPKADIGEFPCQATLRHEDNTALRDGESGQEQISTSQLVRNAKNFSWPDEPVGCLLPCLQRSSWQCNGTFQPQEDDVAFQTPDNMAFSSANGVICKELSPQRLQPATLHLVKGFWGWPDVMIRLWLDFLFVLFGGIVLDFDIIF